MSELRRHVDFANLAAPAITMNTAGFAYAELDMKIGPRKIGDFGVVFLYSGAGWVVQAGQHHTLRGGELFLVFPNVLYAFATTTVRWQVYYMHFAAPELTPLLRRAGVTPRRYLTRTIDRDVVRQWCEDVIREGQRQTNPNLAAISARVWQIVGALATQRKPSAAPASALQPALDHIDGHLTEETPVALLAQLTHLSRFHFMRRFKRETGLSPRQYQINRRMTRARSLLAAGRSAKQVAHELGFRDLFYFSRLFKQKNGVPPSQYAAAASVVESRVHS